MQKQQQIDLTKTSAIKCECGGETFSPGMKLRRVSRLLTGEAKDAIIPVEVFLCIDCGEVLEEFLPTELRKPKFTLDGEGN